MNNIKINHEVPLCLLEDSKQFNDYEFILPHLLDQSEEYTQYMIQAKLEGRYIIMDNSLHELKDINNGCAYGEDRLLHWINELKPQEFIIPDVWQDTTQSIVNARKWSTIELPEEVTKVAVVQANNYTDAAVCYQIYKDLGYKKIAFSYGADYYSDISSHPNKNMAKALGRIQVISRLYQLDVINKKDRVHLLGCQLPQEFSWYKDMPFIETIDTSNPIMAALDGIKYTFNGLTEKPKANMNDNFYIDYEEINHELLKWNVLTFRNLLK
jgi:hypothetical protein